MSSIYRYNTLRRGPLTVTYENIPASFFTSSRESLVSTPPPTPAECDEPIVRYLSKPVKKFQKSAQKKPKPNITNQILPCFLKTDSDSERKVLMNELTNGCCSCPVCLELMYAPFTTPCGHTFCYECILDWLKRHNFCPTCRTDIKVPPILNTAIQEIVNAYFEATLMNKDNSLISNSGNLINSNPLTLSKLVLDRKSLLSLYEKHKAENRLFLDIFRSDIPKPYVGESGEKFCSNCHHIISEGFCDYCGYSVPIAEEEFEEFPVTDGVNTNKIDNDSILSFITYNNDQNASQTFFLNQPAMAQSWTSLPLDSPIIQTEETSWKDSLTSTSSSSKTLVSKSIRRQQSMEFQNYRSHRNRERHHHHSQRNIGNQIPETDQVAYRFR